MFDTMYKRASLRLGRGLALIAPNYCAQKLTKPVFVVGFNNSGKSTAVNKLVRGTPLNLYPGEGNQELWFPDFFPWIESEVNVGPIWADQSAFLAALRSKQDGEFLQARARLGVFQWVKGGGQIVNDSGMLAALAPDLIEQFPDCRFVHFIRDGRLVSYLAARLEWSRIMRSPQKYIAHGCPLDFISVLKCMARYWVWTIGRMDAVSSLKPKQVLELRYEDWWGQPRDALAKISHFLDQPLAEEIFPVPEDPDLSQVLLAEISQEELNLLNEVMGNTLEKKGYEEINVRNHKGSLKN